LSDKVESLQPVGAICWSWRRTSSSRYVLVISGRAAKGNVRSFATTNSLEIMDPPHSPDRIQTASGNNRCIVTDFSEDDMRFWGRDAEGLVIEVFYRRSDGLFTAIFGR
jgi:hypothetical protein